MDRAPHIDSKESSSDIEMGDKTRPKVLVSKGKACAIEK